MEQLTDTELVQWDALLDAGVSEEEATSQLRPASNEIFKDLRSACLNPVAVKHLELHGEFPSFPNEILLFENLESLELSYGFSTVPTKLADLPFLKTLSLSGYELKTLPLEVLAMPPLRELRFEDTSLPKRYHCNRINSLLTELADMDACHQTRLLYVALLLEEEEAARQYATVARLVTALDSKLISVRFFAMRTLELFLADRVVTIVSGSEVVVLGTLQMGRPELKKALADRGAKLSTKVKPTTSMIILGDRPKGRAEAHLAGPLALELHLQNALAGKQTNNAQFTSELRALLISSLGQSEKRNDQDSDQTRQAEKQDSARVDSAIAKMKAHGVPGGLWEELLLAFQNTTLNKNTRSAAQKLFTLHAPKPLVIAVKKVLRRSIFLSSEHNVCERTKKLAQLSKGHFNPVKFSTLLLPNAGYSYLFEAGIKSEKHALVALRSMTSKDGITLNLSSKHLSAVPPAIDALPQLQNIDLSDNLLKDISALCNLKGLVSLTLKNNGLTTMPTDIAALEKLEELNLSNNPIRSFPDPLLRLRALRSLHLGKARSIQQVPLNKRPRNKTLLPALESLHLGPPFLHPLPKALADLILPHTHTDDELVTRAMILIESGELLVRGSVQEHELNEAQKLFRLNFPKSYIALMLKVGELGDDQDDAYVGGGGWIYDLRRIRGPVAATKLTHQLHKEFGMSGRHAKRVNECYFFAQWKLQNIFYGMDAEGKIRALNLSRPGSILRTTADTLEKWLLDLWKVAD